MQIKKFTKFSSVSGFVTERFTEEPVDVRVGLEKQKVHHWGGPACRSWSDADGP